VETQKLFDALLATLPGVLVALVSYWLTIVRERRERQEANANARLALSLEMRANRGALDAFWREINALDAEGKELASEEHLAGMAYGGVLRHRLPHWRSGRWEQFPAPAFGALTAKEVAMIDQVYRDLWTISDLYAEMLALEPDEREQLNPDRFWYNRYAGWKLVTWRLIVPAVERVLAAEAL
jgi:hypothetical protein